MEKSNDEKKWNVRHTWLWKFEIDTTSGRMIFTVGANSVDTVEYYRVYASETMDEELSCEKPLIASVAEIFTDHKGRIELCIGIRQFDFQEVLDVRPWKPTYINEDTDDGFFEDLDIPYEGLTDDEKDAC